MGVRLERARRALTVGRIAHQSGLRRVLAEIGVVGHREATRESAQEFRCGLEELVAQADSIARRLDPELDPIRLIEEESLEVMTREVERRLEPSRFAAFAFTHLAPLIRLPGRVGNVVSELERGTLTIGVVPTGLDEFEHTLRSIEIASARR